MKDGIAEMIRKKVAEKVQGEEVTLTQITKNNGVMKTGIIIKKDAGSKVMTAPIIYIDDDIEEIESHGAEPTDAEISMKADDIIKAARRQMDACSYSTADFLTKEYVLSRVEYRLINRDKNTDLMESAPHKDFLDLAAVYCIIIRDEEEMTVQSVVSDRMMEYLDVSQDELDRAADENTRKKGFAAVSVMQILTGQEPKNEDDRLQMYVVTSKERSNGAAAMMYAEPFRELSDKIGSDLLVLPSSIHEVIAIPEDRYTDPDEMRSIVRTINVNDVSPEEVLSDSVYRFSRETGRMMIV